MNKSRFALLAGLVLAAAAARLLPHAPNFSPVAALALFGGACFACKRDALLVPLVALVMSDLFLGFYAINLVVYASIVLIAWMGWRWQPQHSAWSLAGATLSGAVMFFLITNFGTWAIGGLYPHTAAGLVGCFAAGVPFFRDTLLSDLLYSGVLFGALALAEKRWPSLGQAQAAA